MELAAGKFVISKAIAIFSNEDMKQDQASNSSTKFSLKNAESIWKHEIKSKLHTSGG